MHKLEFSEIIGTHPIVSFGEPYDDRFGRDLILDIQGHQKVVAVLKSGFRGDRWTFKEGDEDICEITNVQLTITTTNQKIQELKRWSQTRLDENGMLIFDGLVRVSTTGCESTTGPVTDIGFQVDERTPCAILYANAGCSSETKIGILVYDGMPYGENEVLTCLLAYMSPSRGHSIRFDADVRDISHVMDSKGNVFPMGEIPRIHAEGKRPQSKW